MAASLAVYMPSEKSAVYLHSEKTHIMEADSQRLIDFGPVHDMTKNLIKVVGVGGGGCNAVKNMYAEGIKNVSFAVCNTDSQALSKSPVPVKIPLGEGLGAGGVPERGRQEAENSIESLKKLFSDGTRMVFVTAGMGGGTGTGAAPVVAGIAKSLGLLTIGIVTIPFYFEKEKKIIKALRGVEEMRHNVDSLLIINNERICDIFSNDRIPVKEAFKQADNILNNAVKSISELITIEGDINLDFRDVESTMKSGGGAIMAIGRAGGEHRVQKAILNALDSPLLYGCDISRAKRILFNIYTSEDTPLFVDEMQEIDAFMDELDAKIDVIWGVSDDNSLGEDAKIAILATGVDEGNDDFSTKPLPLDADDTEHYHELIKRLYAVNRKLAAKEQHQAEEIPLTINEPDAPAEQTGETKQPEQEKTQTENAAGISTQTPSSGSMRTSASEATRTFPSSNNKTFLERLKERLKIVTDIALYE